MDMLNHPIRIADIERYRGHIGLTGGDMAWLLGALSGRWTALMRDIRLTPTRLADPIHALLIRWLADHPGITPSLYTPPADIFMDRLRHVIGPITAKRFAVTLGWDASAGSRWQGGNKQIGPAGRRALALLDDRDPAMLAANWAQWSDNAVLEARLRGIDLFRGMGWTDSRTVREAVPL